MILDKIALALVIIGALNWGGIGLFGFDTVAYLFGGQLALCPALSSAWSVWPVFGASRFCSVPTGKPDMLTALFDSPDSFDM